MKILDVKKLKKGDKIWVNNFQGLTLAIVFYAESHNLKKIAMTVTEEKSRTGFNNWIKCRFEDKKMRHIVNYRPLRGHNYIKQSNQPSKRLH